MHILDAQRELRTRFAGGFFGQLVSGILWLTSAALATWRTPREAIITLVVGGMFIFPITELLVRLSGRGRALSPDNGLHQLGQQVAFVLPLSMPLLVPVALYRLELFFPAMMVLLGAHYLPFVFLYGMRVFAGLTVLLVGGGVALARWMPDDFSIGAWYTAAVLLAFALVGRRAANDQSSVTADPTPVR